MYIPMVKPGAGSIIQRGRFSSARTGALVNTEGIVESSKHQSILQSITKLAGLCRTAEDKEKEFHLSA